MPLATKIVGFAAFGALARAYALGIQRRNPLERTYFIYNIFFWTLFDWARYSDSTNLFSLPAVVRSIGPITHVATAAFFGVVGYGVYHAEHRQGELIEKKHREIAERRESLKASQQEAVAE